LLGLTLTAVVGRSRHDQSKHTANGDLWQQYYFTASANTGYTADTWSLDGNAVQTGGASYT